MDAHTIFAVLVGITLCTLVFQLSKYVARPYEQNARYAWSPAVAASVVILMAIAFLVLILKVENTYLSIAFMAFLATLTLLGLLDARLRVLPNKVTLPLLVIGLALSTTGVTISWSESVAGAISGFMMLYVPAIVYTRLTGRDGVGYGDFKLMAAVGAWIGWQPLLYILFLSGLSVSIFGLIYIKLKNLPRTHTIPFGPFLTFFSIITTLTIL